jgi:hypothetical protein
MLRRVAKHMEAELLPAAAAGQHPRRFDLDAETVALYRFDEGRGDACHEATSGGDPGLTLRAHKYALWGSVEGLGPVIRFERRDDDANVLVGPVDHDALELRRSPMTRVPAVTHPARNTPLAVAYLGFRDNAGRSAAQFQRRGPPSRRCPDAYTVEAWVRYTGPWGAERQNADPPRTFAQICGTDEDGFSLPAGQRKGWSFSLHDGTRGNFQHEREDRGHPTRRGRRQCAAVIIRYRHRRPHHAPRHCSYVYIGDPMDHSRRQRRMTTPLPAPGPSCPTLATWARGGTTT